MINNLILSIKISFINSKKIQIIDEITIFNENSIFNDNIDNNVKYTYLFENSLNLQK